MHSGQRPRPALDLPQPAVRWSRACTVRAPPRRLRKVNQPPRPNDNHDAHVHPMPDPTMLSATAPPFSRGERRLFEGLDFAVTGGEWLHVMGTKGRGKTPLRHSLVGLAPADSGRIAWCDRDIRD